MLRRGVVAVIVRNRRLLAIRRSRWVAAPGAICFPGGGIEEGESSEAALVRELHEELNLSVRPVRQLWSSHTAWRVALAWWLAEVEPSCRPAPNPLEVAEVLWSTPAELLSAADLLASNREFLAALARGEFGLD